MIKLQHLKYSRPHLIMWSGVLALLLTFLAPPTAALAHPLDVYLQATYITLASAEIVVELDLSPGVLVAPQALSQLDTNGDQQISDTESQTYVNTILQNIVLQVDRQSLALSVTKIDMPEYLTIQAGYGTIRVFTIANLEDGMTGTHQLYYKNNYASTGSAYQVNAFVDKDVVITLGKQNRDSIQQSLTMDYVIGNVAQESSVISAIANTASEKSNSNIATGVPVGVSNQARQLLDYLYKPTLSPWTLLLALALAVLLGDLHVLTPGHGKTLVAAYLVGSRGTVRHAISLGAIVTFTHTASVIVIGLLALFASQFVVPSSLTPILEILSGILVVLMGVRLSWQRWRAFRKSESHHHDHGRSHAHPSDHIHAHHHDDQHAAYIHDHGDGHVHSHLPPTEGIKFSSLMAMSISGGLLPCPEALGIMIIAIGLNRILLGLSLIVSFSFGLAAVLIVIGILLVRSRALIERFESIGSGWKNTLPLVSAIIVTVLGIGITFSGLVAYLT